VTTWVEQIIKPRGFSPTEAGTMGALMLVTGVVGAVVLSALSDRSGRRLPFMILALVPFINPALGRLILPTGILPPMVTIPVQLIIIVALLVRARWRKTLARPYAIGLAVYLAALAGLMVVLSSPP